MIPFLVKVGDLKPGTCSYLSLVNLKVIQKHLDQGRFADTIGTDETDPVLALDNQTEILNDCFLVEGLRHINQFLDNFPRGYTRIYFHFQVFLLFAPRPFFAKPLKGTHTSRIPGSSGFDTLPDPAFFFL